MCPQCGQDTDDRGTYCKRCLAQQQRRVNRKRKQTGAYYTPEYIVRYITAQTISKQIEGKTPAQIAELRFADIACGAGAFLLGAYEAVLDYHTAYYNEPLNYEKAIADGCVEKPDGLLRLSFEQKKQILLNNVYGVDIDERAIELAKLTLHLRLIEGEDGVESRAGFAWEIATQGDVYLAGQDDCFSKKISEAISMLDSFIFKRKA